MGIVIDYRGLTETGWNEAFFAHPLNRGPPPLFGNRFLLFMPPFKHLSDYQIIRDRFTQDDKIIPRRIDCAKDFTLLRLPGTHQFDQVDDRFAFLWPPPCEIASVATCFRKRAIPMPI